MPDTSSEPRFRNSRARRRHEDRKLVRVAAAKQLGVSVGALAAQMRSAGITERLEPGQVNEWVAQPAAAPQWFAPALQAARDHDSTAAPAKPALRRRSEQVQPQRGSDRQSGGGQQSSGRLSQPRSEAAQLEQFLAELRHVENTVGRKQRHKWRQR